MSSMKLLTARAWLFLVAVLALGASATAQVSGKLLLGSLKRAAAASNTHSAPSYNWELENGFKEVRPDGLDARRELAVVLLSDPAAAPPASKAAQEAERTEVAFSGGGLLPATIVVRSGSTLLLRNDDEVAHELYATGLAGLSAEPTTPRGRRSVSLPTAGNWPLRDRAFPHFGGHLHVLPNLAAVATLDAAGQFSFSDIQPGKYVLNVYHGEKQLSSQPIELASRSLTLDPIALSAPAESK
jgi:hypothetical protein